MYEFDNITNRYQGYSKKYHKYPENQDIIPLWVADMDFFVAPEIYQALERQLNHRVFGYSIHQEHVKSTIANFVTTKYNLKITENDVMWLPGLVAGINLACRTLLAEDEALITMTPAYPPFLSAPNYAKRRFFTSSLIQQDEQWQINFTELEELIKNPQNKIKLLLLCNPHNPTGRSWRNQELTQLHELAKKYNLYVCSDEIHSGLILDKDITHIPFASLNDDAASRTVTLMAPTKTFNIAGLTCAYALSSSADIKQRYKSMMDGLYSNINIFGVAACEAALTTADEWLSSLLDYLRNNQQLVMQYILTWNGFTMLKNDATYLAWIDGREFAKKYNNANLQIFFEEAGVGLSDGAEFSTDGFLRLNFATSVAILEKALKRMQTAIAKAQNT